MPLFVGIGLPRQTERPMRQIARLRLGVDGKHGHQKKPSQRAGDQCGAVI